MRRERLRGQFLPLDISGRGGDGCFAANNSRCCKFLVAPTILLSAPTRTIKNAGKYSFVNIGSTYYSALKCE